MRFEPLLQPGPFSFDDRSGSGIPEFKLPIRRWRDEEIPRDEGRKTEKVKCPVNFVVSRPPSAGVRRPRRNLE